MTTFVRLVASNDKAAALASAVREPCNYGNNLSIYEVKPDDFREIPGTPFAYWLARSIRRLFTTFSRFESGGRIARKGLTTSNDERYVRVWWEISNKNEESRASWASYAKGGAAIAFHARLDCCVRWDWKARTIPGYIGRPGRASTKVECAELMGQAALTWPLRAARFTPSVLPEKSVFSARGYVIIAPRQDLLFLLALTSSSVFDYLFKCSLGRTGHPEFIVGILQELPIPTASAAMHDRMSRRALRAWALGCQLDTANQSAHGFVLPALLQVAGESLSARTAAWSEHIHEAEGELNVIRAEIDDLAFELYSIDVADRAAMEAENETLIQDGVVVDAAEADETEAGPDESEEQVEADGKQLMASLVSWAIGAAFGRFDIRLANGERPPPPQPPPFDPLPPCSPGMLTGQDGLPLETPPAGYPIAFPRDGILADDPGDRADITDRMRAVFGCVFGADADRFWAEVSQILGSGDGDLRRWLSRSLFDDTIRRYSKSRRKAPIYWQLATPSANYSVWLYYHRLTKDTFYTALSDYIEPKLQHEERRLGALLADGGNSPNAGPRRQIAEQEAFVEELRAFREEVVRIAPLWNPKHDDGVIINFAPLWRLVPQHRAWQRECKECWDKLVECDYEWSHLAMHLWPERVVPKCADDRSLALAHALEDRFWVEDLVGRWRPRQPIDGTVRYLEQQLLSRALTQTLRELEAFSSEQGARHAGSGRTWWEALSRGDHDDHPLALALWPARVLSRARVVPGLAAAHGIGGSDRRGSSRQHEPRHDQAELAMVASFCDHVGSLSEWSQRWAALHTGGLDEEPIARFLYPRRVVERAQRDQEFATKHDLARWFWLDESGRSRRLMEPAQEQAAAIKERESPAVKAALKSLLEAPVANGGIRRGRRRAAR